MDIKGQMAALVKQSSISSATDEKVDLSEAVVTEDDIAEIQNWWG